MPTGESLRQLFRGHTLRDDAAFRDAAEAIVREERAKNHRLLADDLERILREGRRYTPSSPINGRHPELPKDKERGFPLITISEFDHSWDRLILPSKTISILERIAEEHQRRDLLISGGVRPKRRVLFFGPPGCGKTLAAKVMSSILSRPLVTVRFDAVVSSYLGETAANLRRVFDFIERDDWVVLFDEFDAIGKDRDNPFEHGELKRVVNTLLQLMDAFRGESLLIAATNHEGLLDSALWRRFEALVQFPVPREQDRLLMLRLFLKGYGGSDLPLPSVARQLGGATGADIERVAIDAIRSALLTGRRNVLREDLKEPLTDFRERTHLAKALELDPADTLMPAAALDGVSRSATG
ncbi:MAG: ATP-binding protein [Chloroflexota bacterium]|nr:ATP-binding protein [Chloroflexota bacterium]